VRRLNWYQGNKAMLEAIRVLQKNDLMRRTIDMAEVQTQNADYGRPLPLCKYVGRLHHLLCLCSSPSCLSSALLFSLYMSLSPLALVSLSVVHATADDGTNDVALMRTFVITTDDTQLATACFIVATAGF
jgi:hypothetical protein